MRKALKVAAIAVAVIAGSLLFALAVVVLFAKGA
jgi:hypothetical protein